MFKKLAALSVTIAVLLSGMTVYAGSGEPSEWAKMEVREAIKIGFVPERLQSNYQSPITREEFAELALQSIIHDMKASGYVLGTFKGPITAQVLVDNIEAPDFTDTDLVHVKAAYILGIINGTTDTTFEPYRSISRQEAAVLMANVLQTNLSPFTYVHPFTGQPGGVWRGFQDYYSIPAWAVDAVDEVAGGGVMKGTGNAFDPLGTYTREQAILTVLRSHRGNLTGLNLRGVYGVSVEDINLGYSVGKDFVRLKKQQDRPLNSQEQSVMDMAWFIGGKPPLESWYAYMESIAITSQGCSPYTFHCTIASDIRPKRIEYGFMTMTLLSGEYFMEAELHNVGYVAFGNAKQGFGRNLTPINPVLTYLD